MKIKMKTTHSVFVNRQNSEKPFVHVFALYVHLTQKKRGILSDIKTLSQKPILFIFCKRFFFSNKKLKNFGFM
jgi:hypothetical protein